MSGSIESDEAPMACRKGHTSNQSGHSKPAKSNDLERVPDLISALKAPDVYPHPVDEIQLIETHASWVILTGTYAYKIKKPINLEFLNFSTLERRHFYCAEELRLNRRFAPDLYLDVVTINASPAAPQIGGNGPVIEYAVKMRQFPQEMQLDRLLESDQLGSQDIEAAASWTAQFHMSSEIAAPDTAYGTPDEVLAPVLENFEQTLPRVSNSKHRSSLEELHNWSEQTFASLRPKFDARKKGGFIRECHGDLHLSNLIRVDHKVIAFDCLEFDARLRWIDVISEIAFLVMDFEVRNRSDMACYFANRYVEITGDYFGIELLRFYLVYKSLVRAKVAAIRMNSDLISSREREKHELRFARHVELARSVSRRSNPMLVICCGVSGSGKTSVSRQLLAPLSAFRIRSDIERKRLHKLDADQSSHSEIGAGIYSEEATIRTYDRLGELVRNVIAGGFTAIVDAAFLDCEQRRRFRALADRLGVPFAILLCTADPSTLRQRVLRRSRDRSDVSEATLEVLEHQLKTLSPLNESEKAGAVIVDTGSEVDVQTLANQLRQHQQK